jgi:4-amino-4-deoxy-L-arabinose transferase-like glycosyltransferase
VLPEHRYLGVRFAAVLLLIISLVDLLLMVAIVLLHAALPGLVAPDVLAPMTFILAGASFGSALLAFAYAMLRYPQYRGTILALVLIVSALLAAHMYTIGLPSTANCHDSSKNVDGCIMDEVYYVPAAQTILSGEKCAPYADNCNLEHPFLSKAIIAAGIAIFGNNVFGWRIFEALLGTFSVPILFGICWALTRNARFSLFASFLLAFETLFFVQSSIAVIDIHAIFFGLLGILLYVAKVSWWRFSRTTLAGIAMGLSALSKETSIFLLLVLVGYILLLSGGGRRARVATSLELLLTVFIVFAVGLQAYDSLFGSGTATTFIGQIAFILSYGKSLTMTPSTQYCLFAVQTTASRITGCGWIDSVLNMAITPLNWISYYSPIGYLITNVSVTTPTGTYNYVGAGYYGIADQFEVWLTYLWGAFVAYYIIKKRASSMDAEGVRDFKLAKFALLWFLVIFGSYMALFLYGRVTYPYYFVQAIPAIAIGCAYLLTRQWFPREIAYMVLVGVGIWFFLYYPDKAFLPTQVRAWLGR